MLLGLAAVGIASLALGGCAGAVLTDQPARSATAAQVGSSREEAATANRAAARRDVVALLSRLRLPEGAKRAGAEPPGDNGYLKPSPGLDGDSAHATASGWWTIDARPGAVIAYVSAHRPAGSTPSGTGSSGNSRTGTSASMVGFQWPTVGNVLGERQLQVTVTALPNGRTGIIAEAQSDWVVLRSWSERVPAGVTAVTIERAPERFGAKRLGKSFRTVITSRRAVAESISIVDSLPVVQPIVLACPLLGVPAGSLTVTFSAGPAGPTLAKASVGLFAGLSGEGAGVCDPIAFSIRGHAETALMSGSFVQKIDKLAGFPAEKRVGRLPFGPGPVVIPTAHASAAAGAPSVNPAVWRGSATGPNPELAVNQAAARRDAALLLSRVRLPAGAVRVDREPRGDHRYLAVAPADGPGRGHRWWVVPGPASEVIAYLDAHHPAGSRQDGRGYVENRGGTSMIQRYYVWPSVGKVLGDRSMWVMVTPLSNDSSGVLADVQSTWLYPRAPSEKLPSGVTAVRVTLQRPCPRIGCRQLGPKLHAQITTHRDVASAVRLVDSLGVVQADAMSCTLEGEPAGHLEVTYSAGPAGPALAKAEVTLYPSWKVSGENACDPISFSVHGHIERALIGRAFVPAIEKLADFRR
jgi:hypothetical protein